MRLVWGARSERFFEIGVDNGVLYNASDSLGVSWSGLVSVSESSSGGEPRPYYIDGVKYANLASAEEYQATIVALGSPAEFDVCDGVVSINNGLFATQQPRKSFGLSYRTRIGNEIEGANYAYKLHLVYNALAAPSQRKNDTIGDTADPSTFTWAITTLPPEITGYKRTSHFIVDSRFTPELVLTELEDILYGTESTSARLPDTEELLAIFA